MQYFNDSQEIDMEFLSSQYNSKSGPVNLVLQSPESARNGFNAVNTGTFLVHQLPFPPDDGFHEYRFDWLRDSVSFYADGVLLTTMTQAVPNSSGHLTLSHWSNGDPGWSGGPPAQDAIMTVAYIKAYFNSSSVTREQDWSAQCKDSTVAAATCRVLDSTGGSDGNASSHTFFHKQNNTFANPNATSGDQPRPSTDKKSVGSLFGHDASLCILTVIVVALTAGGRLFDHCL